MHGFRSDSEPIDLPEFCASAMQVTMRNSATTHSTRPNLMLALLVMGAATEDLGRRGHPRRNHQWRLFLLRRNDQGLDRPGEAGGSGRVGRRSVPRRPVAPREYSSGKKPWRGGSG